MYRLALDCGGYECWGGAALWIGVHAHRRPPARGARCASGGDLETLSSSGLAALTNSGQPTLVSVGMATINALLPQQPELWVDLNAGDVISEHGADKSVVLIGHFPFVDRLRTQVGKLTVLELDPRQGDLPVSEADTVIPDAQVIAITGMTLLNHTFEGLLNLCAPEAFVILLGPSVPLSPVLFKRGVDILCGSVVTSIDAVLAAVRQGANFRQVHRAGVRLVTITEKG